MLLRGNEFLPRARSSPDRLSTGHSRRLSRRPSRDYVPVVRLNRPVHHQQRGGQDSRPDHRILGYSYVEGGERVLDKITVEVYPPLDVIFRRRREASRQAKKNDRARLSRPSVLQVHSHDLTVHPKTPYNKSVIAATSYNARHYNGL